MTKATCVACVWLILVFIFMPGERQLVVECFPAHLTVHDAMGALMVVFQLLGCVHLSFTHAASVLFRVFRCFVRLNVSWLGHLLNRFHLPVRVHYPWAHQICYLLQSKHCLSLVPVYQSWFGYCRGSGRGCITFFSTTLFIVILS